MFKKAFITTIFALAASTPADAFDSDTARESIVPYGKFNKAYYLGQLIAAKHSTTGKGCWTKAPFIEGLEPTADAFDAFRRMSDEPTNEKEKGYRNALIAGYYAGGLDNVQNSDYISYCVTLQANAANWDYINLTPATPEEIEEIQFYAHLDNTDCVLKFASAAQALGRGRYDYLVGTRHRGYNYQDQGSNQIDNEPEACVALQAFIDRTLEPELLYRGEAN